MKQSNFYGLKGPKSERFSGGEFRFVVKALDGGSGNHAFGLEPVQNELPMFPERFGHLLHGLDPGPHGFCTPAVQEPPCLIGREVVPKKLEIFFQQVASDRFQIILEEIGEFDFLLAGKIFGAFE